EYLSLSPRHHFHGGNQLGGDAIGDQASEALLFRQHVADALDFFRAVLDSKHNDAARSVRERYNGFQYAFRGGKIALELQRFSFGTTEEGYQIHNSAFYSEVELRANLPSTPEPYTPFIVPVRDQQGIDPPEQPCIESNKSPLTDLRNRL